MVVVITAQALSVVQLVLVVEVLVVQLLQETQLLHLQQMVQLKLVAVAVVKVLGTQQLVMVVLVL